MKLRAAGVDNFRITALVARNPEDALMFAAGRRAEQYDAAESNVMRIPM